MSKLYDLNRIGHCLQTAIIRLKREVEMKFYGPDEVLEAEKAARAEEVGELHEKIELEIRARKNLEAMLLKQKKSTELQNAEYGSQIDTHLLNFQMMVACKAEADEKNASLSEQRRLLIKEVKRARSKLTETEASLEQVEGINTKLTSAVTALQAELAEVKRTLADQTAQARVAQLEAEKRQQAAINTAVLAALDAVRKENSNSTGTSEADHSAETNLPAGVGGEITLSSASTSSDTQDTATTTETAKDASEDLINTEKAYISPREVELLLLESQAIVSKLQPIYNNNTNRQRRTSSGSGSGIGTPPGSLSTCNSDSNLTLAIPGDRPNSTDSASATPQTPMDLKGLGWLSPEQEKLVDSRIQLHQQQRPAVEAQYKYLETSERTAVSEGAVAGTAAGVAVAATSAASTESSSAETESTLSAASMAASSASAAASSTFSMFSGAMSMLSSTASATLHSATGQEETPSANNSQKRTPKGIISSIFLAEKDKPAAVEGEDSTAAEEEQGEEEDPERLPSAMRLNCLRCAGTVEGPKYSTCKCSVPALMPEDLQSSSTFSMGMGGMGGSSSSAWGFSMLSKSSSAFVGGLAKASQVTQSNVESLMKAAKSAQQAPSAGSGGENAGAAKDKNAEGYMFYNSMVSSPVPAPTTAPTDSENNVGNSAAITDSTASETSAASQEVPPEQDLWNYFIGSKGAKTEEKANSDADAATVEKEDLSLSTEKNSIEDVPSSTEFSKNESSSAEEVEVSPGAVESSSGAIIATGESALVTDLGGEEEVQSCDVEEAGPELDSNVAFI